MLVRAVLRKLNSLEDGHFSKTDNGHFKTVKGHMWSCNNNKNNTSKRTVGAENDSKLRITEAEFLLDN